MKVAVKNNNVVDYLDELMQGSNRLSPYNYTGTNDPFYEPYTFYTTLCNNENTYYVYDHSSGILTASLGNTRITYTPTVMPDGLKFTLNGVYDYYPYGKILREYVQGPQEKYLTTHHQRDEETGLDYRGARFYDCDVARFLSLDPLAVKYNSLSPFNYVANNPITFIDKNGKDVTINDGNGNVIATFTAAGVTIAKGHELDKMVTGYIQARDHIVENSSTNLFSSIENNAKFNLTIKPLSAGDKEGPRMVPTSYSADGSATADLVWSPNVGLETATGSNSPAGVLVHETVHADNFFTNPLVFISTVQNTFDYTTTSAIGTIKPEMANKKFDTKQEQITIATTNAILKNVPGENANRQDHTGKTFITFSPISSVPCPYQTVAPVDAAH